MKIKATKTIIFYILIIFIGLIFVGLVGAIIRLINIPAIIVTLIIIGFLSYYKRIGSLQNILNSILYKNIKI